MNYYSFIYGLVTNHDMTSENGGLFLLHSIVLKLILCAQLRCVPDFTLEKQIFNAKMESAKISEGLYLRSANHKERTVSHDEITGFIGTSASLNTDHSVKIWKYLSLHGGHYNATGKEKSYNFGAYYFPAVMNNSWVSFIYAPIYTINMFISINTKKEDTSSKLIYLDELYLAKDKSRYALILWEIYQKKMRLMYGDHWIRELYAIYFKGEPSDHPLIELSRKL